MGKVFDSIDEGLARFIEKQQMFFVATAPRSDDGLVNLSPKGIDDTFAILGPTTVAYLDLTGSGVETVAHVRENGRITLLFCAFEGPPRLVRIHGTGEAIEPHMDGFAELARHFGEYPSTRSIIRVEAKRISDSCGFGVPLYSFQGQRGHLTDWATAKGLDGVEDYQRERNATSLDGLPGVRTHEHEE